jgi:thiosulfate reductase cytochrome b subunit
MKYVIGILALAAFFTFATAQMAAGYAGIEHGMGHIWALAALFAAIFLRFTAPITIGAFFGAMHLWSWHWALALCFAAPGLVFVLPGVISAIFSLTTEGASKLTRATPIWAEH